MKSSKQGWWAEGDKNFDGEFQDDKSWWAGVERRIAEIVAVDRKRMEVSL